MVRKKFLETLDEAKQKHLGQFDKYYGTDYIQKIVREELTKAGFTFEETEDPTVINLFPKNIGKRTDAKAQIKIINIIPHTPNTAEDEEGDDESSGVLTAAIQTGSQDQVKAMNQAANTVLQKQTQALRKQVKDI